MDNEEMLIQVPVEGDYDENQIQVYIDYNGNELSESQAKELNALYSPMRKAKDSDTVDFYVHQRKMK